MAGVRVSGFKGRISGLGVGANRCEGENIRFKGCEWQVRGSGQQV